MCTLERMARSLKLSTQRLGKADDRATLLARAQANKTNRGRTAYDEMPDYFKVKDSKNSTVLCYGCSGSSLGHRPIIQCDYCNESWHLDCLDPPLANPPARTLEGKKIHDWMCPLHIDHELRHIDVSMLAPRRKVHLRRPKNARVVESALTRGFRNTGIIDVAEDESDDSDSEFYDEYTPQGGVVYRMPASGIKLDFIDKIKRYVLTIVPLPRQ